MDIIALCVNVSYEPNSNWLINLLCTLNAVITSRKHCDIIVGRLFKIVDLHFGNRRTIID